MKIFFIKIYILIILVCSYINAHSQCNLININLPDTTCTNTYINSIINNPSNYQIKYDLCAGDISEIFKKETFYNPGNLLNNSQGFTVVEDNGAFYSFVVNRATDNLLRFDFTSEPSDTFQISDLGNPFNSIAYPIHKMEFIYENNKWYGFLPSSANFIIQYEFANGLSQSPTASVIHSYPSFSGMRGIEVLRDSGNIFLASTNTSNGTLTLLKFINGIDNPPVEINIVDSLNNTDNSLLPWDITFIKECNSWIALVVNQTGELVKLNFGSSLLNNPVRTNLGNFGFIIAPTAVEVLHENGNYFCFVQNTYLRVIKISFGNSFNNTPALITNSTLSDVSDAVGLDAVQTNSHSYLFSIGSNTISRLSYFDSCTCSSPVISGDSVMYTYTAPGWKHIEVTVRDSNNNETLYSDSIYVNESPLTSFTSGDSSSCINNQINFTNTSIYNTFPITSYIWNFGDGDTSNSFSPVHTFINDGFYNIQLTAANNIGCTNTSQQQLHIYPLPFCDFSVVSVCENDSIQLINNSFAAPNDSIISYQWISGNGDTSYAVSPKVSYNAAGDYTIQLSISTLKSCNVSTSKVITIRPRPHFNISIDNTCLGSVTQFLNQTNIQSPAQITAFNWDLDDNASSSLTSPSHLYSSAGLYNVTLFVQTDNNCDDSIAIPVKIANRPVPDFSYTQGQLCESQQVVFTDLSSVVNDTLYSWVWNFDNGDSSFIQNPIYNWSNSGTFNVTLTAASGNSCDSSITKSITITDGPDPGFIYTNTCKNKVATFTDTSKFNGGSVTGFNWTIETTNYLNPVVNHTFSDTGNFIIHYTVTASNGCSKNIDSPVYIYENPIADFTNYLSCTNNPTKFFNSSNSFGNIISSYLWYFANSDTSSSINPEYSFQDAGNIPVSLIITMNNGCIDTVTKNLSVKPSPVADFSTSAACEDKNTRFTDQSLIPSPWYTLNRQWDFGDGTNGLAPVVNKTYTDTGSYTVMLHITASSGCKAEITKQVKVHFNPVAAFEFSNNCLNTPTLFADLSTINSDTITGWEWKYNSTVFSGIQNPQNLFSSTGNYSVLLKVNTNAGCIDTISHNVRIGSLPQTNFSFSPDYGNPPEQITFTNLTTGAESFFWSFGNNTNSTDLNPIVTFNDSGLFTITLTSTDSNNCSTSLSKNITMYKALMDIALMNLNADIKDGYVSMDINIVNLGTVRTKEIDLIARINGESSVKEVWSGTLNIGSYSHYSFNTQMQFNENSENMYLCVNAANPNNRSDDRPENNEICVSLKQNSFKIADPFPNPSNGEINIPFILPEKDDVKFYMYDSKGSIVSELLISNTSKGLNQLQLNTSALRNGIYEYRIEYQGQRLMKRFIIMNQ